jgi:hypothetical protein
MEPMLPHIPMMVLGGNRDMEPQTEDLIFTSYGASLQFPQR